MPTLQNPSDGSTVPEGDISFSLINASDPDQDVLTYTFMVSPEAGGTAWSTTEIAEGSEGTTSNVISSDDLGGPGSYRWTAFATDDEGLQGPTAVPNEFLIGATGDDDTEIGDDDSTIGDDDTTPPEEATSILTQGALCNTFIFPLNSNVGRQHGEYYD
jgi:hypothetical protein